MTKNKEQRKFSEGELARFKLGLGCGAFVALGGVAITSLEYFLDDGSQIPKIPLSSFLLLEGIGLVQGFAIGYAMSYCTIGTYLKEKFYDNKDKEERK